MWSDSCRPLPREAQQSVRGRDGSATKGDTKTETNRPHLAFINELTLTLYPDPGASRGLQSQRWADSFLPSLMLPITAVNHMTLNDHRDTSALPLVQMEQGRGR